jgi:DNA-binding protein Fis
MKSRKLTKKIMERLPSMSSEDVRDIWFEIILERTSGNRSGAAKILGVSACTLRQFIKKKGIASPAPKVGRPFVLLQK